jgi:hypothetical protein
VNTGSVVARVMRLRPKSYRYDRDYRVDGRPLPAGLQYGFIAQELARVFPALVVETDAEHAPKGGQRRKKRIKAVDYGGFVAILVAAVQEQQRTIEGLTRDVASLRAPRTSKRRDSLR